MRKIKTASYVSMVVLAAASSLLLASCAHHRDVRPSADGIHRVTVRAEEKEDAERSAIRQAEHYCEQQHKTPAIVEEKTTYTGSMDEQTRDTVRKASTAAKILGGGAVAQHGTANPHGTVLGTAGVVGGAMTSGDDYQSEMRFKCQ